jgi:replicative DNA helicase
MGDIVTMIDCNTPVETEERLIAALMVCPDMAHQATARIAHTDFSSPHTREIFRHIEHMPAEWDDYTLLTAIPQGYKQDLVRMMAIEFARLPPPVIEYVDLIKKQVATQRISRIGQALSRVSEKNAKEHAEKARAAIDQTLASQGQAWLDSNYLVKEAFYEVEASHEARGQLRGVTSGFTGIDKITNGFRPGHLGIIAARPAMGKTALATDIALAAACHEKKVALVTLEMAPREIMLRMLCGMSRVSWQLIQHNGVTTQQWQDIAKSAAGLAELPIKVLECSDGTCQQIAAHIRNLKNTEGCDIVIIDYLQLMRESGDSRRNREQEVSAMSRSLKLTAQELDIPVLVLSQLNRAVESRTNKRPQLSDLRESGALEQDADLIIFVHRPEVYEPENPDYRGKAELIIGKNRHGPTGIIDVAFLKDFAKFGELSHEY